MSRKKPKDDWQPRPRYSWDSEEAKAIKMLHQVAGRMSAFWAIWWCKDDRTVTFGRDMTDQIRAFAKAPDVETWVTLTYQQAGSWEEALDKLFPDGVARQHLREGSRAPWPWPPSLEGRIYPDAQGVPPLKDEDHEALANEGR